MSIKGIYPITQHPETGKTIVWCSFQKRSEGFYTLVEDLESDSKNWEAYSLKELGVSPEMRAKLRLWVWQNVATKTPKNFASLCNDAIPRYTDSMNCADDTDEFAEFCSYMVKYCNKIIHSTNYKITF